MCSAHRINSEASRSAACRSPLYNSSVVRSSGNSSCAISMRRTWCHPSPLRECTAESFRSRVQMRSDHEDTAWHGRPPR